MADLKTLVIKISIEVPKQLYVVFNLTGEVAEAVEDPTPYSLNEDEVFLRYTLDESYSPLSKVGHERRLRQETITTNKDEVADVKAQDEDEEDEGKAGDRGD